MRAMSLIESPSQPRYLLPVLSLSPIPPLLVSRFLPVVPFFGAEAEAGGRRAGWMGMFPGTA